jgi:Domain of unknown function (DUF4150)
MATVFANGRSILHAGDGNQHVAAPPDVCKTPSPGGPVPIPYVNVASDGDLAKGTKKTQIEGKSVALESSNLGTSTGDEPGTAGGGIVSSKTKGKLTWGTASADVKFEGKGVVRFMDVTQHNGNSFNSAFTSMGGTGLAYADDFEGPCQICTKGPAQHRLLETGKIAEKTTKLLQELDKAFKAATDDDGRRKVARSRDGVNWTGYMIGVVSCKCDPPKYFCTNSGQTMPGLQTAANAVGGFEPVISGGAASQAEFVSANQTPLSQTFKEERVANAFKAANQARTGPQRKSGYNPPGVCAGAKLVARCSHAPMYMCEMFFAPPGTTWQGRYRVLTTSERAAKVTKRKLKSHPDWAQRVLANKEAKDLKHDFEAEESVASCHTCQDTLFLTMCPERKCS